MSRVVVVRRQLLGDVPAVDAGHHHVEEHERRTLPPDRLERLGAVRRLGHREPVAFEVDAADRADRALVVDEEDERRRFLGAVLRRCRRRDPGGAGRGSATSRRRDAAAGARATRGASPTYSTSFVVPPSQRPPSVVDRGQVCPNASALR